MMRLGLLFILILGLHQVMAETPNGFPNPLYNNNNFTIRNFIVGRACYSLRSQRLGYQCNPAFLADNESEELNFSLLLTDSISKIVDYAQDTDDRNSVGIIRRGLNEKEPLLSQAALAAWYRQDWWEITLAPLRLGLATDVRNPALPEMTTFATLEHEVSWRFGFYALDDPNFRVGANTRFVNAKYFNDRFEILSASVGTETFSVKEGNSLYFEPSLSYSFDTSWDPVISASLTDLALLEGGDKLPTSPLVELGYTTTPEFLEKRFTSTIHVSIGDDLGGLKDRVSWAGYYNFSNDWEVNMILGNDQFGIGIEGNFDSLILGIGYKSEKFDFGGYSEENVTHWISRIGLIF